MAGTIVADTLTHSTAGSLATNYVVRGSAKAWSSLDSSGGSTTTQHGSLNISSVLDDGVGQYGFNFTNSMSGATYSTVGEANDNVLYNVATNWAGVPSGYSAGRTGLGVYSDGGSAYVDGDVSMQVVGDLA